MGWWLAGLGAALGVLTAFVGRVRWPGWAVAVALGASGAVIGWGGLAIRSDPSTGEAVLTVTALAVLVPFHVRVVLGPFGPRRAKDPSPDLRKPA